MRLARLADIDVNDRLRRCYASLDATAPEDFRELAALLACQWSEDRPVRVGIGGGQGAGKSTLSALVEAACTSVGLRGCVLSLDDFYLLKSEREELAKNIHPLFETRGPPGTHDLARCRVTLEALGRPGPVEIPIFDKAIDDRIGDRSVTGPFDIVVLEGWCVGARAVADYDLADSINSLEVERDSEGVWRRGVNRILRDEYQPIWDSIDFLVYLRVPSLDAVRRWREQQEEAKRSDQRLNQREVEHFVQFFERITLRMIEEAPKRADWVVSLDEHHRVDSLVVRRDR